MDIKKLKNDKNINKPFASIEEMHGIVNATKFLSKKEYKNIIRDAVIEKFNRKNAKNF